MKIEKSMLNSMAWYRLTKVIYFVLLAVLIVFSVAVSLSEPYVGIGALVVIGILAEIIRQSFFYIVTGDFLNNTYKVNLIKTSKVLASILVITFVIILGFKIYEKVSAAMCESKFGSLGTYENGSCDCIYGYSIEDGTCVSDDEICQRNLGENGISIANECVCKTGFSIVNGVCVETDDICAKQFGNAEGVPGTDKCVCKSGYHWNEGRDYCVKTEVRNIPPASKQKCSEHGNRAIYNAMNDTCECKSGYVKIDGICQTPPYCGKNAYYDENAGCTCDFGYKRSGDSCVQPDCPANSSYNSDTDKCQCNRGYLIRSNQCISAIELCGILGKYNTKTEDCTSCDFGYYVKGRNCVPEPSCGIGGTFNAVTEECECMAGFSKQSNGMCGFD